MFNENASIGGIHKITLTKDFVSNGTKYGSISIGGGTSGPGIVPYAVMRMPLYYGNTLVAQIGENGNSIWVNDAYRKIIFDSPLSTDDGIDRVESFIRNNAVKQDTNLAVQPEKTLTITSNGSTTITPDVPYDAMASIIANVTQGTETTRVNVRPRDGDMPIGCAWQSVSGWLWTGTFETGANFTISDVLIGGYIVFFRDPMGEYGTFNFVSRDSTGVEEFDCYRKDTQYDKDYGVMVVRVTAANPTLTFQMSVS